MKAAALPAPHPTDAHRLATAASDAWDDAPPAAGADVTSVRPDADAGKSVDPALGDLVSGAARLCSRMAASPDAAAPGKQGAVPSAERSSSDAALAARVALPALPQLVAQELGWPESKPRSAATSQVRLAQMSEASPLAAEWVSAEPLAWSQLAVPAFVPEVPAGEP